MNFLVFGVVLHEDFGGGFLVGFEEGGGFNELLQIGSLFGNYLPF